MSLRLRWKVSQGWRTCSAGYRHKLYGKFLFFGPDWKLLAHLAEQEILEHGFPLATIPRIPKGGSYVLCLFDYDNSRSDEIEERYEEDYDDGRIVYRGWKPSKGTSWQPATLCGETLQAATAAARKARPERHRPRTHARDCRGWPSIHPDGIDGMLFGGHDQEHPGEY